MQRWMLAGAVAAALGALLYLLHLAPDAAPSPKRPGVTTSRDEPRAIASAPVGANSQPTESSQEQTTDAGEEDVADAPGTSSLWGQVTDPNGHPLEDVSVRAVPSTGSSAETRARSTTDAQGRFRLRSLITGNYALSFARSRFLALRQDYVLTASSAPLVVKLQSAPLIQGRVVDPAGNPLSEAEVDLYKIEPPTSPSSGTEPKGDIPPNPSTEDASHTFESSTETEADGTFTLDTTEPGSWFIRAHREGIAGVERNVTSPSKDVWLVLGTGASVDVSVVDEREQPVSGASVSLWQGTGETQLVTETSTHEDGHTLLQGVESGQYQLMATSPRGQGVRATISPLSVRGQQPQRVRLRFEEGLSISGVVVDGSGRPIPDVEIQTHFRWSDQADQDTAVQLALGLRNGTGVNTPFVVHTGQDGRFTLSHLRQLDYWATFEKLGYSIAAPEGATGESIPTTLTVSPGQGELRVVLHYNGLVSGRVVRATDGEPFSAFEINGEAHTSPDGTFTVTAGNPGHHSLEVLVPRVGGLRQEYEARAGENVNLGDLVLGDGRPVHVRTVDSVNGLPLNGVELELRDKTFEAQEQNPATKPEPEERGLINPVEMGLMVSPVTREDGSQLLPDVPARPLVLTAKRNGYGTTSVELGSDEREVTVRMQPWATVQGWVRANGAPIPRGSVTFYMPESDRMPSLRVTNGWYTGHRLPPGRYLVRAECDTCREPQPVFLPRTVEVPAPPETLHLDFEEARGTTLEVHISPRPDTLLLLPGQHPLPIQGIQFETAFFLRHPSEWLEAEQSYRFRGVPAGHYTLLALNKPDDGADKLLRQEVEVPAEGVLRIQFQPQ